jgi:hypothetical protein
MCTVEILVLIAMNIKITLFCEVVDRCQCFQGTLVPLYHATRCHVQEDHNIVQCWGFLIVSDHLLYRVTPLKTSFGLVIPLLQSQSHVTTITHNYLLHCYVFAQL